MIVTDRYQTDLYLVRNVFNSMMSLLSYISGNVTIFHRETSNEPRIDINNMICHDMIGYKSPTKIVCDTFRGKNYIFVLEAATKSMRINIFIHITSINLHVIFFYKMCWF